MMYGISSATNVAMRCGVSLVRNHWDKGVNVLALGLLVFYHKIAQKALVPLVYRSRPFSTNVQREQTNAALRPSFLKIYKKILVVPVVLSAGALILLANRCSKPWLKLASYAIFIGAAESAFDKIFLPELRAPKNPF